MLDFCRLDQSLRLSVKQTLHLIRDSFLPKLNYRTLPRGHQ